MAYQILDEDGQSLDSHFDLNENQIIVHSRGGVKQAGTNTDYGKGLRLILSRIHDAGLKVTDAWVDSSTVQGLSITDRRIIDVDHVSDDPSTLFTELSRRMKAVGRDVGLKPDGGNSTKRIRLVIEGTDRQSLLPILRAQLVEKDFRHEDRLPAETFDVVNEVHAYSAINVLRSGVSNHEFGQSTDYDLVLDDGLRLPPKAVFGIAATEALGFSVLPKHFTGGEGSICFRKLREWGYQIDPKSETDQRFARKDQLQVSPEDRAWSEGRPRLVKHLNKERSAGLPQAKRQSFRQEHGKLFCERCKCDPVEQYGEFGEACIEVHHKKPISEMVDGETTKLHDVECLCANCHRIVHRLLKVAEQSVDAVTGIR